MPQLNMKAEGAVQEKVLAYLVANASEELATKINAGGKTLAGCMKYAKGEAEKLKESGSQCVMVEDATVFGWIIHFFEEDTIEEPKAKPKPVIVPKGVKVTLPVKKQDPQMGLFDSMMGNKPDAKTEQAGTPADQDVVSGEPEADSDGEPDEHDDDLQDADSESE